MRRGRSWAWGGMVSLPSGLAVEFDDLAGGVEPWVGIEMVLVAPASALEDLLIREGWALGCAAGENQHGEQREESSHGGEVSVRLGGSQCGVG